MDVTHLTFAEAIGNSLTAVDGNSWQNNYGLSVFLERTELNLYIRIYIVIRTLLGSVPDWTPFLVPGSFISLVLAQHASPISAIVTI